MKTSAWKWSQRRTSSTIILIDYLMQNLSCPDRIFSAMVFCNGWLRKAKQRRSIESSRHFESTCKNWWKKNMFCHFKWVTCQRPELVTAVFLLKKKCLLVDSLSARRFWCSERSRWSSMFFRGVNRVGPSWLRKARGLRPQRNGRPGSFKHHGTLSEYSPKWTRNQTKNKKNAEVTAGK